MRPQPSQHHVRTVIGYVISMLLAMYPEWQTHVCSEVYEICGENLPDADISDMVRSMKRQCINNSSILTSAVSPSFMVFLSQELSISVVESTIRCAQYGPLEDKYPGPIEFLCPWTDMKAFQGLQRHILLPSLDLYVSC
ncbi:hypothetical protein Vadar_012491 [Vaccinium darrowii]|uniref:Uncharacterized protein n=1 Tax=Vaccinium darrowii TaxID=229202 RepID=A0ACB7ZB26_9ERIC|nr:hypothetical protein Vadar_012491 [Vaccinium darrowii]